MLFRNLIAVNYQNYINHAKVVCGKKAEFWRYVTWYIIITEFERVKVYVGHETVEDDRCSVPELQ